MLCSVFLTFSTTSWQRKYMGTCWNPRVKINETFGTILVVTAKKTWNVTFKMTQKPLVTIFFWNSKQSYVFISSSMGVKLQSSILGGGGVAATVILEQVQYLGVYVFAHTVYDTGLCLQYIYNIYIYIETLILQGHTRWMTTIPWSHKKK